MMFARDSGEEGVGTLGCCRRPGGVRPTRGIFFAFCSCGDDCGLDHHSNDEFDPEFIERILEDEG